MSGFELATRLCFFVKKARKRVLPLGFKNIFLPSVLLFHKKPGGGSFFLRDMTLCSHYVPIVTFGNERPGYDIVGLENLIGLYCCAGGLEEKNDISPR